MTELPRSVRDGIVIGATQAVVLLALVIALTALLGNQQEKLLRQIVDSSRAQVCVAALPLTSEGRAEAAVNRRCLIPNNIPPLDTNDDGTIEGADNP